jgi:hypothetical protein
MFSFALRTLMDAGYEIIETDCTGNRLEVLLQNEQTLYQVTAVCEDCLGPGGRDDSSD